MFEFIYNKLYIFVYVLCLIFCFSLFILFCTSLERSRRSESPPISPVATCSDQRNSLKLLVLLLSSSCTSPILIKSQIFIHIRYVYLNIWIFHFFCNSFGNGQQRSSDTLWPHLPEDGHHGVRVLISTFSEKVPTDFAFKDSEFGYPAEASKPWPVKQQRLLSVRRALSRQKDLQIII